MIELVIHPHIDFVTNGNRENSPVIEGTRVSVAWLFAWHRRGTPINTLLKRYPQIKPAAVLSALAFAYDNEQLVRIDMAERELEAP